MYNRRMVKHHSDTHPEIAAMQTQLLRQLSPAQRLEKVAQLNQTAKMLALAGLKSRYPDDSPDNLKRRFADLVLGTELAYKVYGPLNTEG